MSYGDDIEGTIESIADDRIISALDNYDPTDSYSFAQGVESIVDERVDNLTFDDLGAREYIDENMSEAVEETLRYRSFTSEDVEDFDSAVLAVLQEQADNISATATDNGEIRRRVNDLEIQVASLLETNQRLLAALTGDDEEAPIKITLTTAETVPAFPDFAAAAI